LNAPGRSMRWRLRKFKRHWHLRLKGRRSRWTSFGNTPTDAFDSTSLRRVNAETWAVHLIAETDCFGNGSEYDARACASVSPPLSSQTVFAIRDQVHDCRFRRPSPQPPNEPLRRLAACSVTFRGSEPVGDMQENRGYQSALPNNRGWSEKSWRHFVRLPGRSPREIYRQDLQIITGTPPKSISPGSGEPIPWRTQVLHNPTNFQDATVLKETRCVGNIKSTVSAKRSNKEIYGEHSP